MRNLERGALLGCGGVLAREIIRPARTGAGVNAKKFAQCAQNTPNSAFLCLLGEFFRGKAAGGAVLGEFFRADWCCAQVLEATWRLHTGS